MFSESDVVAALKKAAEDGVKLQNIRSPAGFERRLNDMTCSGCHQTRGIGGFHFPASTGWRQSRPIRPSCRRRRISSATRSAAAIFSPRCATASRRIIRADFPAARNCAAAPNSPAPNMTTAGARIAMLQGKPAAGNDGSFRAWTCAEGLSLSGRRQNLAHGHVLRQKPLRGLRGLC